MQRQSLLFLFSFLISVLSSVVIAEVPQFITYQGRLTDTLGYPITGEHSVVISIYETDTDLNPLWTSGTLSGTLTDGLFSIYLGPIPADVFASGSLRYLGVAVDGNPEMTPRNEFTAVPYAYVSLFSDTAGYAANVEWYLEDGVLYTNNQYGLSRGGTDNQVLGMFKNTMVNLGHHSTVGFEGMVENATIGGGGYHFVQEGASTICGGIYDTITGGGSTIAGGSWSTLSGNNSWMGGSFYSLNAGNYCSILGGQYDTIPPGTYGSYLFGLRSKLTTDSTFMVDLPYIRFGDEASGYVFPSVDGSSGQALVTDGNGQLSWTGASGGPWIEDGNVVRLADPADSVGIGTSNPEKKLQVEGGLKVGSTSNTGGAWFYGDRSEDPYAIIMQNGATYGQGGELHLYGAGNGQKISFDANYADEPLIQFNGSSQQVVFMLDSDGDDCVQFPSKAINQLETLNEAGVGNARRTSGQVALTADDPTEEVIRRVMSFPTSGYVLVIATAQLWVNHTNGVAEVVYLGVSDQDDAFPTDLSFEKFIPSGWQSMYYRDIVTVHAYFPVDAGISNLSLLARQTGGSWSYIYDVEMNVIFFPTNYSFVIKAADEGEQTSGMSVAVNNFTMEDVIADRVEQQTSELRSRFQRETAELREENQQLIKRMEALEAMIR